MKVHSLEMNGPFFIEQIKKRSIWSLDNVGQVIYESNSQLYWLGGVDDWLQFNLNNSIIKLQHLKIGLLNEYISSNEIPCEFNGNVTNLQNSISFLNNRQINESTDIKENSVINISLDINANSINDCGFLLETLVSDGDIYIHLDSTSHGNLSIRDSLNDIEVNQLDLTSSNIGMASSSLIIQNELDNLFSSDPVTGEIHELSDFAGWECDSTSVTEFFLKTTGIKTIWECMNADSLLFNVNEPTIIPPKYLHFQQFLDSCGGDIYNCKPYIITDILIVDTTSDFQEIYDFYYRNHPEGSPNLLYDLSTNNVYIYYNGLWELADIECHKMADLTENRIYIVPVTNTIFYLDCNKLPLKLFDKKRLL